MRKTESNDRKEKDQIQKCLTEKEIVIPENNAINEVINTAFKKFGRNFTFTFTFETDEI